MKLRFFFLCIMAILGCRSMRGQGYRNPVIAGFHPDPSVCRVGDDFYAVNSSFNYFPGVPIFHSKDLIHWKQIGNVLDRPSQLPLTGANSWLGIYAPTIRYHDGTFYMITTNVGNGGNFMVTANNPRGPWSEPIWLEQQGIDPSLYFEGGKCYMVSNPDGVITLCEIDPVSGRQTSPGKPLWKGDGGRYPEGPHIYKKDGYYYLLISEGGTELAHHLTIARSKNIYGPYQSNPANPILTNCNAKGENMQIQGTGHGDFVQDGSGRWWVMFLAYRNYGGSYHHLGRETCVAPMEWDDGEWPVIYNGNAIDTLMTLGKGHDMGMGMPRNDLSQAADNSRHIVFKDLKSLSELPPAFVYLQNPIRENYQLTNGRLRLTGNGTLTENRNPTFLGLRQCSEKMELETVIDLKSISADGKKNFRAGLSIYQIHDGRMDLLTDGHSVSVICRLKSLEASANHGGAAGKIPAGARVVRLKITSDGTMYRFFMAVDQGMFSEIGAQNCMLLSTEVVGGFTGVTMGMVAEGDGWADYESFRYVEF